MKAQASRPWQGRLAAWLVAVWAGCLLALAAAVAPIVFQTFPREVAGGLMGRLLAIEAAGSCLVAVMALILYRQGRSRTDPDGSAGGLDAPVMLLAGALFCTVAGYYGLQPVMAQSRTGTGPMSFATAHGLSMAFYVARLGLLGTAAWRMIAR